VALALAAAATFTSGVVTGFWRGTSPNLASVSMLPAKDARRLPLRAATNGFVLSSRARSAWTAVCQAALADSTVFLESMRDCRVATMSVFWTVAEAITRLAIVVAGSLKPSIRC
jgi:hypothetical protein